MKHNSCLSSLWRARLGSVFTAPGSLGPSLLFFFSLAAGCAPVARERFGGEARYAPDLHGYVVGKGPATYLLHVPLTWKKIRCREDLGRWLAPEEKSLARYASDDNQGAAPIALTAALFDLGVASLVEGSMLATLAAAPGAARSGEARSGDAVKAMNRGDYAASARILETVLARDDEEEESLDLAPTGISRQERSHALYLAGLSHGALGKAREARVAFAEFVDRSTLRDEKAYALAEKWLAALGAPRPARCAREDVAIVWPDAK